MTGCKCGGCTESPLDFVEDAGRHLWAAMRIYRANVPPDEDGGPDVSLLRFLYNLQEGERERVERPTQQG